MKKIAAQLILAFFFFNYTFANAQTATAPPTPPTDLTNLNLEQLMNIEVTSAEKKPEKFFTTPAAIYVITAEDIARSTATSIPELLRMVPGVNVQRITSNTWTITIRGFNGLNGLGLNGSLFVNKVLVLIDGRTVYSPIYGGVYWDTQDVPLEDIERIEVIRGSGGTLYGANAVDGVINIITKRPKDTQGGLATVTTGSEDRISSTVQVGARSGGWDYRVYGKEFREDQGIEGPQVNDWDEAQGGFRAEKDKWNVQGDFYQGYIGQQTFVDSSTLPFLPQVNEQEAVRGWNVLSRYEDDGLSLQAYWDRTERYSIAFGQRLDTINLDYTQHHQLSDMHELVWGSGYNLDIEDNINTDITQITNPSQTNQVFTTFLQDEMSLTDRLKFILGSKFEYNIFTHFEMEPNARLSYELNDTNFLWAAASRAIRTPSRFEEDGVYNLHDAAAFPTLAGLQISGNDNLKSEKMLGYEIGYRNKPTENSLVDLSTFYDQYSDLATLTGDALFINQGLLYIPFHYVNGMTAHTYGLELSVEDKIKEWWKVKGDYTLTKLNLNTIPSYSNAPSLGTDIQGETPLNAAYLQSSFDLPKGFEFDATLRYSDRTVENQVVAPAYIELDLRLGWTFKSWKVDLVGQNLLQPRHVENALSSLTEEVQRGGYLKLTRKF